MPQTVLLQDYLTLTLSTPGQVVTQNESDCFDASCFQDLVVLVNWTDFPASGTFYIDQAAVKEESLFTLAGQQLVNTPGSMTSPGLWSVYGPFHWSTGTTFFGRYIRWRLVNASSTPTWGFRILLVGNLAPSALVSR